MAVEEVAARAADVVLDVLGAGRPPGAGPSGGRAGAGSPHRAPQVDEPWRRRRRTTPPGPPTAPPRRRRPPPAAGRPGRGRCRRRRTSRAGTRCSTAWRRSAAGRRDGGGATSPAATSGGMSHVAKAQKTTDSPPTRPRVARTIGASAISRMRAPASTVIAHAPMATQYGGSRSTGRRSKSIIRRATNTPAAAYRKIPTDQETTASSASAAAPPRREHRLHGRGRHRHRLAGHHPDEPRPVRGRDHRPGGVPEHRRPRHDVAEHQPAAERHGEERRRPPRAALRGQPDPEHVGPGDDGEEPEGRGAGRRSPRARAPARARGAAA